MPFRKRRGFRHRDIDFARKPGKIDGFFRDAIRMPDDHDVLPAEKRPVARSAIGNPLPEEFLLAGHLLLVLGHSRGDDDGLRAINVRSINDEMPLFFFHFRHFFVGDLYAEIQGLLHHVHGKVRSRDARKAWIVVDAVNIQKDSSRRAFLEHDGLEVAPTQIDPRGEARGPRPDHDDIALHFHTLPPCFPYFNPRRKKPPQPCLGAKELPNVIPLSGGR